MFIFITVKDVSPDPSLDQERGELSPPERAGQSHMTENAKR
jgi:hypothetical protein